MSENRAFLGIKQVKKETFDELPESGKTGYLWFVREHMPDGDEPDDCQIFLGNRKYGETSSDAVLKNDIIVTDGAPIGNVSLGVWSGDTITKGTPIEEVLMKLLTKELFPGAPTKPSISASGTAYGVKEIGSTVSIAQPTPTYNSGEFKSSGFTSPSQPSVAGVTWSNTGVTSAVTGFTISGNQGTVVLGSNEAKYTFKGTYSEPSNMPITNLKNKTKSRTSIYTGVTSSLSEDDRATWVSTGTSKSASMTATGVYPCFSNISGSTLIDLSSSSKVKCAIGVYDSSTNSLILDVPAEVGPGKHFTFAYPFVDGSSRTMTIQKYNAFTGQYENYQRTPETGTTANFYSGWRYKTWKTTGDLDAAAKFKIYFSPGLNKK